MFAGAYIDTYQTRPHLPGQVRRIIHVNIKTHLPVVAPASHQKACEAKTN